MTTRLGGAACLVMCLAVGAGAADKKAEPYAWPAVPDAAAVKKAMVAPTQTGLVLISRESHVTIRSLGAQPPQGVVREEFLRFVVANEYGASHASIELNDDTDARVTTVEGRTIGPDGAITPLDADKDVHRTEITEATKRKTIASLARVDFPAPAVGALLDLHFVSETDELKLAYAESMAFEGTPSLQSTFKATLYGGFPGVGWSVVTLGPGRARIGPDELANTIRADMGYYAPPEREPLAPPSYHEQMTMLSFLNLDGLHRVKPNTGAPYHQALAISTRGLIEGNVFPTKEGAEYWDAVLKGWAEEDRKFIKHDGSAEDIDISAARAGASLDERLRAIYRATQASLKYDPDSKADTLSSVMKKGMSSSEQGTLLMAYLLGRAGIPYRIALVANRYALRFSPLVHNEYLYGFSRAIAVDRGDGTTGFFMPGELSLPYGALPDIYQDSLALTLTKEEHAEVLFTSADPSGTDTVTGTYELALDGAGDVAGTVALDERGAPAWGFARWYAWYQFRAANPTKDEKKDAATTAKKRADELRSALEGEVTLPGTVLKLEELKVTKAPTTSDPVLGLAADATGKGLAQEAGGQWLVNVYPALAGFSNPFIATTRRSPIWYPEVGRVVLEGDLKLPAGAAVVELPKPWELAGPDGTTSRGSVEARTEGGTVILHSRIEFDRPVALPPDMYDAWRAYQANLAKVAQDRAIVTMTGAKELE